MLTRSSSLAAAGGLLASLALAACAGGGGTADGGSGASSGGMVAQLTFPAEVQGAVGGLGNFNPYSPNPLTTFWLYEPLIIKNGLTCEETPWLATKAEWTDEKTLVIEVRDGVKWSDGKPFTANDVAFTFNLAKQYPGMDKAGVWTETFGAPATSVTAEGNTVTMAFSGNAAAKYDEIIKQKMLPEHVYSKVGDPTKYIDKKPVSTGPYELGSFNGRRLVLDRRPDYWQADKVKVQKIVQEGQYDASQAALKLRAGELDAYWGEIPNPEKTFVSADKKTNHFYYAPNGMTILTGNLEKKPFDDPKFREAISYAMDKEAMSTKATYGVMKPASQTGLKLPSMEKLLPDQYQGKENVLPFDTAKANQLLDAAGYAKGADGKRTLPDGSPLALNFSVQAGWIDYQAIADVVAKGLNDVGVATKVTASAPEAIDDQKKTGEFQVMLEYLHGGCELARNIGAKLSSTQVPTQKEILPNVGRFSDPAVDATVTALGAATDEGTQRAELGKLVDVMMTQYPVTSLIYAPTRLIYRTDKATGWPSEQDPYANPSDDRLLVLTRLAASK